jgi:hypothetical protein
MATRFIRNLADSSLILEIRFLLRCLRFAYVELDVTNIKTLLFRFMTDCLKTTSDTQLRKIGKSLRKILI